MKKLKYKNWFTLIEVIIATSILTIAVFWVYKLIWENTKIINNSWYNLDLNYMVTNLIECIENVWFSNYTKNIWEEYNFNLWPNYNECNTWTGSEIIIDNISYELKWKITDFWTGFIKWEYSVNNWISYSLTWSYIQIKN